MYITYLNHGFCFKIWPLECTRSATARLCYCAISQIFDCWPVQSRPNGHPHRLSCGSKAFPRRISKKLSFLRAVSSGPAQSSSTFEKQKQSIFLLSPHWIHRFYTSEAIWCATTVRTQVVQVGKCVRDFSCNRHSRAS